MPGQFESILDKLQAKLGKQTIRKASTISRPRPKFEVQQIKIFNEFNRRNPRADGGLLNGSSEEAAAAAFRKKVDELMDDGYDFGEAVREAMRQGYKDGGLAKIRKRVKKKFPNKKLDFKKYPKYGMPKKDPDYDKARYDPEARKKRTAKDRKDPKFLKKRRARAKDYYTREKENILKRLFDKYRSDTTVGKTGKTLKQLTKEKNIGRILKIQDTIGIFPSGYTKSGDKKFYKPELAVWRDLYDSTRKQGQDRWVLPKKYKDNVPLNEAGRPKWAKYNYYKKIKFVDKKTGEIIKLDETIKGKGKTLKEYLDTTIAKETGEKRVFQKAKDGYELKNKIKDFEIDFKGNKERLGTLFAKASSAKSGDTVLSAFEVHHPYGKKNNWWNNQVALREANRELNYIDTRLQRAYKNAPTQAQKNKIFKQFGKEVDKLPGGITYFFEGQQVGTRMPTLKSILNEGAKYYQMAKPVAKKIASVGKAIAKPVVRLAAPIIPFAGPAIMMSGAYDVAKAAEQGAYGLDESPVAYYFGPEAALGLKGLKERAALSENTPYREIEDYLPEEDLSGIVSLRGVQ